MNDVSILIILAFLVTCGQDDKTPNRIGEAQKSAPRRGGGLWQSASRFASAL